MKKVLLVIDVQNEYFTGKLPVSHPSGSFENILKAMDAANAGAATDEELHRAILVTQAMRFSKVMKTSEWINSLKSLQGHG